MLHVSIIIIIIIVLLIIFIFMMYYYCMNYLVGIHHVLSSSSTAHDRRGRGRVRDFQPQVVWVNYNDLTTTEPWESWLL